MLRVLWFLKNIVQGTHKPQPLDDSSTLLFEQNKIGKHLAEVNLTKKTQLNKNLEKNAFFSTNNLQNEKSNQIQSFYNFIFATFVINCKIKI